MVSGPLVLLLAASWLSCKRPADKPAEQTPDKVADRAGSAKAPAADVKPATRASDEASATLSAPPAALAQALTLRRVAQGLQRPVALEVIPGDDSGRLFIVEQHVARIRIARTGPDGLVVEDRPFLDLGGQVETGNEQGLLGLVFHPRFADNRRFYINYTGLGGATHVIEYRVDASDPERVDPAHQRLIFKLDQPYSNHNAGDLEFGPDGKLYVGTGDGGAANDPLKAGQDRTQLLAKMLRFDVDGSNASPVSPEMVHIGLRNPWRYHFDARTSDLYIADVGQNLFEFVYVVAGDDRKSHNFGWNVTEGSHCFLSDTCDKSSFTPPIAEYDHEAGCSITGGIVYRGKAIPELDGVYFYADYCTSIIRSLRWSKAGVRDNWRWRAALDPDEEVRQISSFGSDHDGEMYVVSLEGDIFKLVRK